MREYFSKHFNERKAPIDMLVLHATAHEGLDAIECFKKRNVSAHYLLVPNGEMVRLVDEEYRAWHAGVGYWRGLSEDLNSHSIGIEICSPTLGQEYFTAKQIERLIIYCRRIINKYKIIPQNIVGHSDIAPLRKPDPGLAFPWKLLAFEGIGLWYQINNADKIQENDIAKLLNTIGYDTRSEDAVNASAYAFCRRFLPKYVKKVSNVKILVDDFLPNNFAFMYEEDFIRTLKAVVWSYQNWDQTEKLSSKAIGWSYQNWSQPINPCKI